MFCRLDCIREIFLFPSTRPEVEQFRNEKLVGKSFSFRISIKLSFSATFHLFSYFLLHSCNNKRKFYCDNENFAICAPRRHFWKLSDEICMKKQENLWWYNGKSFERRECLKCENYAIIFNGEICFPFFPFFFYCFHYD